MRLFNKQLAIDFGTTTTRIYTKNKGVVLQEPTLVARYRSNDKIIAFGHDAEAVYGRENEEIEVVGPLNNGVIADFTVAEKLLSHFIQHATGRWHIGQPEAMITTPNGATSTEQRAVIDLGKRAGLKNVYLISSGVASALGAGLPIIEPRGHMIMDIGSGVTEIAVMSLGGVISSKTVRTGGQNINDAITRGLRREFGLLVGVSGAEEVKRLIGSVAKDAKTSIKASGRSTHKKNRVTSQKISSRDIKPYIESSLEKVIQGARQVLEKTPPDLVGDIAERGIVLCGGGAYLQGIDEYFSRRLDVEIKIAQDPLLCSVKGAFTAITHLNDYRRSLLGL